MNILTSMAPSLSKAKGDFLFQYIHLWYQTYKGVKKLFIYLLNNKLFKHITRILLWIRLLGFKPLSGLGAASLNNDFISVRFLAFILATIYEITLEYSSKKVKF